MDSLDVAKSLLCGEDETPKSLESDGNEDSVGKIELVIVDGGSDSLDRSMTALEVIKGMLLTVIIVLSSVEDSAGDVTAMLDS